MGVAEMPPHSPREPEIRVHHGVHLAVTIILLIVTFGTLGWLWVIVWVWHAVARDAEQRRYDRELREWQDVVVQWQADWRREHGHEAPALPPGW